MNSSNAFIYIAIGGAVIFTVFSLIRARSLPLLAEVFEVMLSLTAAYSGVVLCADIVNGVKELGDYGDQRLTIVLAA